MRWILHRRSIAITEIPVPDYGAGSSSGEVDRCAKAKCCVVRSDLNQQGFIYGNCIGYGAGAAIDIGDDQFHIIITGSSKAVFRVLQCGGIGCAGGEVAKVPLPVRNYTAAVFLREIRKAHWALGAASTEIESSYWSRGNDNFVADTVEAAIAVSNRERGVISTFIG